VRHRCPCCREHFCRAGDAVSRSYNVSPGPEIRHSLRCVSASSTRRSRQLGLMILAWTSTRVPRKRGSTAAAGAGHLAVDVLLPLFLRSQQRGQAEQQVCERPARQRRSPPRPRPGPSRQRTPASRKVELKAGAQQFKRGHPGIIMRSNSPSEISTLLMVGMGASSVSPCHVVFMVFAPDDPGIAVHAVLGYSRSRRRRNPAEPAPRSLLGVVGPSVEHQARAGDRKRSEVDISNSLAEPERPCSRRLHRFGRLEDGCRTEQLNGLPLS